MPLVTPVMSGRQSVGHSGSQDGSPNHNASGGSREATRERLAGSLATVVVCCGMGVKPEEAAVV